MSNIINIIEEKNSLETNNKLIYIINKKILWVTYAKPILKSYKLEKLSYKKLEDFIYYLQMSKYKYNTLGYLVNYSVGKYFRTLTIEDTEYKLKINIYNKDKSVDIEYIIKESDTRYIYNIPSDNSSNKNSKNVNYIYNQLHDNINSIINNALYLLVKDYVLND